MSEPYRTPGECLPDRPEPPAIRLPRGKGVWINMLEGRGRDLRAKRSRWAWLNGVDKVPLLMVIAGIAIVAAVVIAAATGNLGSDCQCSCSPKPCTCQCQGD